MLRQTHVNWALPPRSISWWWWVTVCCGGLLCACLSAAADRAMVGQEYLVKAAFLYNFTKFVEWPPQHFTDPARPIRIGIFGHNPFGDGLRATVSNRFAHGRPLEVVELRPDEDPRSVDLIFVSEAEERRFAARYDAIAAAGVLTVGESESFAAAGGMITFVPEGDNIRFAVNVPAAQRAGLKVSSKLLSVALTVKRGKAL